MVTTRSTDLSLWSCRSSPSLQVLQAILLQTPDLQPYRQLQRHLAVCLESQSPSVRIDADEGTSLAEEAEADLEVLLQYYLSHRDVPATPDVAVSHRLLRSPLDKVLPPWGPDGGGTALH